MNDNLTSEEVDVHTLELILRVAVDLDDVSLAGFVLVNICLKRPYNTINETACVQEHKSGAGRRCHVSHDKGRVIGVGTINLHQHLDGALGKVTLQGLAAILQKKGGACQALKTGVIVEVRW